MERNASEQQALAPRIGSGRLHYLDYLRGLAAFGIMIFHYSSWLYGNPTSDSFLARIGVYGVSIFYILSGLTLCYVYDVRQQPSVSTADFAVRRIFRIFPLLWLVTLFTLLWQGKFPTVESLFLNLTGLFGFVDWDHSVATGTWSIGNELVFYVLFIPYMFLLRDSRRKFVLACVFAFLIYLYFPVFRMDPSQSLFAQWRDYVNPLNQFFLFLSGMIIGYALRTVAIPNGVAIVFIVAGLALFILVPAEGDWIDLVTGVNRLAFTLSCLMICIGFYKINFVLPVVLAKPLTLLGDCSYCIYLIHPLVYNVLSVIMVRLSLEPMAPVFSFALKITVTLVSSYCIYMFYEKPFTRLGRMVRWKGRPWTWPFGRRWD